jgi:hypothetical protein
MPTPSKMARWLAIIVQKLTKVWLIFIQIMLSQAWTESRYVLDVSRQRMNGLAGWTTNPKNKKNITRK